jgi:hypothetical protein
MPKRALLAAFAALAVLAGPADALARPHISSARCWRSSAHRCRTVSPGAKILLSGRGFRAGAKVYFTVGGNTVSAGATRVLSSRSVRARVPSAAVTGPIFVREPSGRSNSLVLRVRRPRPVPSPATQASGTAFDGNGMWIWYVSRSSGGSPAALVAKARQHAISTVFIKSSDGSSWWSQFDPQLVATLKASGLHVCAWQYVYGSHPAIEARLGAQAVAAGADCLAIDAEQQYEGRYSQARTYIADLRAAVGPSYPLGLASFPYVDYHPALPYSVFLGPNGAQFDVPQIYWKAIGVSVTTAVDHTYNVNAPYGRPIAPLGQAYDNVSPADILRFRALTETNGAPGVSWWDWQEATGSEWQAIGQPLARPAAHRGARFDTLARGAKGDLVVWAQEHLRGAGQRIGTSGYFDAATERAVTRFQRAASLNPSGRIDKATWRALLRYTPTGWSSGAHAAGVGGGPRSASLPAVRYEIPPRH